MGLSREMQEKIDRFAKEQSQHYLRDAEMTYMEKLRRKGGQARKKIGGKLARFKGQSGQGAEAQNDMTVYMTDYMNDLVSRGLPEQEAFEKASGAMRFAGESEQSAELQERFARYYENPAAQEAIGVFYAGFMLMGTVCGGFLGYLSGGGRAAFLPGGWIDAIVGAAIGLLMGAGIGMVSHGVTAMRRKK